MATFRNKTMVFASGKQTRVEDGSLSITPSMEISEGRSRNILAPSHPSGTEGGEKVINVYQLSDEEALEMAESNIKLWREFKERVKKYGVRSADLFY